MFCLFESTERTQRLTSNAAGVNELRVVSSNEVASADDDEVRRWVRQTIRAVIFIIAMTISVWIKRILFVIRRYQDMQTRCRTWKTDYKERSESRFNSIEAKGQTCCSSILKSCRWIRFSSSSPRLDWSEFASQKASVPLSNVEADIRLRSNKWNAMFSSVITTFFSLEINFSSPAHLQIEKIRQRTESEKSE